jgi:dihydrofolate synthase/folylpolyglutamate synthase
MSASSSPLQEWLTLLETYSPQEIDLGLERVDVMLQRMQLPTPEYVFHVAGTNGKGSSAMMLESLLRQSGMKVGCYTSPHLQRYNERIRVDGHEVNDGQIVAAFESIDALRGEVPLTYFEFGTLAALVVFAECGVEIAVLEVGMGGRLDAVNAVEPTASLITNVSLDHCEWLGADVETIAVEKAGVMRATSPVVFASPELPQAIVDGADSLGAKLYVAERDYQWVSDGDKWSWSGLGKSLDNLVRPALVGDIQLQNAAGVLALLQLAGFDELLDAATVNAALSQLKLSGRMQRLGKNLVFDVAHNAAAATALASALTSVESSGTTIVVLGMLDDKDVAGVVTALAGKVAAWIAVTAGHPRAIPAAELARQVANVTGHACLIADSIESGLVTADEMAGNDDLIVVTGSFYVVGAALTAYSCGILAAPGHHDG